MFYNVSMDICALIVISVIIFTVFYRKTLQGISNRIFLVLAIDANLTTLVDIIDVILKHYRDSVPGFVLQISSYAYFYLHNITAFIFMIYVISITDTWYKVRKDKKAFLLLYGPVILNIVLITANFYFGWIFYYDKEKNYFHGKMLTILYAVSAYYLIYAIFYAKKYKDIIDKEKRMALFSFFPLTVIPVGLQILYPHQLVEMFGVAVCLLLIVFTIQRSDEVMDGTTGLWNRHRFLQGILRNFYNNRQFTVIAINIENIPVLNQSLGFVSVEEVLAEAGCFLRAYVSIWNEVYYMGNGKFNVILKEMAQEDICAIAEEINEKFYLPWKYKELELNLVTYVCKIDCPADVSDKDSLVDFTDSFHKGLPCTGEVLYAKDILKMKKRRAADLERIIEKALIEKKFEVYYQPIYSAREERYVSAEALLRLHDEVYGFISPEEFIPVAEQNSSILQIGMFVLESVCEFLASEKLKEKGIQFIEINLSVVQCMQSNLAEQIIDMTKRYGIAANQINLEITETAAAFSQDMMLANMQKLTDYGINFSLDDYGTGYSNINYAVELPFELIKLDKSIVCSKNEEPKKWIALINIIRMITEMEMEIVAEGIETGEMVEELKEQGCHYLQGYYFSRPLIKEDFIEFLKVHNTGKAQKS